MKRQYYSFSNTLSTDLVILTSDQVNNKNFNGKDIIVYQLERGSSNGYYIAEIEYIENDEDNKPDNPFENY